MKHWKLALAASAAMAAMAGSAMADDIKPSIVFNAGIANEYSFRGLSQTRKDVQVFGGADVTAGKFYVGTWVSNVDFNNGTDAEVDLYGGVKPTLGPVSLDLGVIAYLYPGQPSGPGTENYVEFKGAASVAIGKATLGGVIYHSPQFAYKTGHATYIEGNVSVPIVGGLSASGAVGHQFLQSSKNFGFSGYTTYNVGLTYAFNSHLSLDARYIGNDHDAKLFYGTSRSQAFNARNKFVATLKVTFP
jgi:uncharacterized protein (TIGR02001 family)